MRERFSDPRPEGECPGPSLPAAVVGSVVLGVLLIGLVVNELWSGWNDAFPRPMRASTVVDVAAQGTRARMVNPIVAAAAESAGGKGTTLELPADHRTLLDIDQDVFADTPQATLNAGLISPFLGGRVTVIEYDAVLEAATLTALRDATDMRGYPRDVWALVTQDDAETVRLFVDTSRTQVFLVEPGVVEAIR